jgi:hypothetical protein
MEVIGIPLARIVVFLEIQGIDPSGRTSTPEVLKKIQDSLTFTSYPKTFAELDFGKGVDLLIGKLNDINIDKLTIFANALSIDTHSSTDEAITVLEGLLSMFRDAFGAKVRPSRTLFLSHVLFRTTKQLSALNPILQEIANEVSASASRDLGFEVPFEPSVLHLGGDLSRTRVNISAFTVERRLEIPFSDGTYFSQAPLRTGQHVALLEKLEQSL